MMWTISQTYTHTTSRGTKYTHTFPQFAFQLTMCIISSKAAASAPRSGVAALGRETRFNCVHMQTLFITGCHQVTLIHPPTVICMQIINKAKQFEANVTV